MIVVACYNNPEVIDNFMSSLNDSELIDEQILLVCTDSSQTQMIKHLSQLKNDNLLIDVTPYKGYDTGAFIWAYKNYKSDYYIFLQESLIVNKKNWYSIFKSHRKKNVLSSWCTFDLFWDNQQQKDVILSKIENNQFNLEGKPVGVFGNMFQIDYESLKKIDDRYNLNRFIPNDKVLGSCAMERGWSYLAKNCGIEINNIDGYYSNRECDYTNKLFLKKFHNRF